jgi:hypothetical protein
MPIVAHPICVLTLQFMLIHSLHYARKALRRDAKGLMSHGERPRDIRGRSFVCVPGSKTLRRDAKGLLPQGVIPRENRAVEVWQARGPSLVLRLLRPFFWPSAREGIWHHPRAQASRCV